MYMIATVKGDKAVTDAMLQAKAVHFAEKEYDGVSVWKFSGNPVTLSHIPTLWMALTDPRRFDEALEGIKHLEIAKNINDGKEDQ